MSGPQSPFAGPQRFIGAIFGAIFFTIGLFFIGFLWTEHGFGEPPLLFKLVGSLISFAFIAMGGTVAFTALKGQLSPSPTDAAQQSNVSGTSYSCPACGARLGKDADVSPKGDVKCGYCRKWFNIHGG